MATQHSPADDIVFDLVSVQYHALKAAQAYDSYVADAEGHDDVQAFFKQCAEQDAERVLSAVLPRDDRWAHRHGSRGHGADHILPLFVAPSLTLPVIGSTLELGVWQSVVLVDANVDNPVRTIRLSLLRG